MVDALGDGECHLVWVELERVVMSIGQEGSAHKTWADVVEVDVADVPDVAELGEAFHIVVDVAFRGGIGRCCTESACAGNAADNSEMPFLLRMR